MEIFKIQSILCQLLVVVYYSIPSTAVKILPGKMYAYKLKHAAYIEEDNMKGGDHFVDSGTEGRIILKGLF
jgi:hypothetical protein